MGVTDGFLYPQPVSCIWRATWDAAIVSAMIILKNNQTCGNDKLKAKVYANRGGWQVAFYFYDDISPPF